jgi:hypothetical protein
MDAGGPEPMSVDLGNYTSNVSGIWAACLTAVQWHVRHARTLVGRDDRYKIQRWPDAYRDLIVATDGLCLRDLHGISADIAAPLLRAAAEWGSEHLGELRKENPKNGWGDADGALEYLRKLRDGCETHPRAQVYISS